MSIFQPLPILSKDLISESKNLISSNKAKKETNANNKRTKVISRKGNIETKLAELEDILYNYVKYKHGINLDFTEEYPTLPKFPSIDLSTGLFANSDLDDSFSDHRLISTYTYVDKQKTELKLYFDAFLENFYPTFPFFNLRHIQLLFKVRPLHTPILYVIYIMGQYTLLRKNNVKPLPSVEDNYFYHLVLYCVMVKNSDNSLIHIQTLVLLAHLETQLGMFTKASLHITQAIKKMQMLDIDQLIYKPPTPSGVLIQREKEATWAMAKRVDCFISGIAQLPNAVHSREEDWKRAIDHYNSYLLINELTSKSRRERIDISDNDLSQYQNFLAIELYTFSVFMTNGITKFKKTVREADILDEDIFVRDWEVLTEFVISHPMAMLDGAGFMKTYELDNPQYNMYLVNFLMLQFQSIGITELMVDFLERMNQHSYPSPSPFFGKQDVEYYRKIRDQKAKNLIQLYYAEDSKRTRNLDDMRTIDFAYLLPHFYIYKYGDSTNKTLSLETVLSALDFWPCMKTIFHASRSKNGQAPVKIQKFSSMKFSKKIKELSDQDAIVSSTGMSGGNKSPESAAK
jgi:hypothetical protein